MIAVDIVDSVGERAELVIDTDTYRATLVTVGPDGSTKREAGTYVRSAQFIQSLRAQKSYQKREPKPFFRLDGYDAANQRLILRTVYDPAPTGVPLKVPPQLDLHVVDGQFAFLESKVGCAVSTENMGGLLDSAGATYMVIDLFSFLKTAESPFEESSALITTETLGSGDRGTIQEIVNSVVSTHYGCEVKRGGGVTADGFVSYRSLSGQSRVFVRRTASTVEVLAGFGWNAKGRAMVTGPDTVKITDRRQGAFTLVLNHADKTYTAAKQ
jgi:hypothetical protein